MKMMSKILNLALLVLMPAIQGMPVPGDALKKVGTILFSTAVVTGSFTLGAKVSPETSRYARKGALIGGGLGYGLGYGLFTGADGAKRLAKSFNMADCSPEALKILKSVLRFRAGVLGASVAFASVLSYRAIQRKF